MRSPLLALAFSCGLLAAAPALADVPKVVASIKPVHSLVSAVMQGVGEPALIVRGAASPHDYTMKPSDARALQGADFVFWVGEALETFLVKPLKSVPKSVQVVELLEAPGITLLEAREGGAWETHDHGHAHKHDHAGKDHGDVNTHVWLDPDNARAMARAAAEALAARDPAHAATYRANAEAYGKRLDALDAELKAALAPVAARPFVVFHDAYQYFEKRYGLNAVGAITVNPERAPSAKRVAAIRERIRTLGAACVFAEPQFEPKLVDTLIEGTGARKGTLDPEGAAIPDGPELYPTLLRSLANSLTGCLAPRA
ncbi:zinc ABC transporter substrate-binding protein ZnuA [Azospirillum sp.]|uniref:zinc ABC transporter substrate-binding protein ZnuA n=1 Tax=Azospirillum sp. TaxID=34012 RepID=UPI002D437031|nr:zinc ABC transporter substrate-binding protein ZnuA [Azospirillum sp.]HYD64233.1 zinc ABC transporter substrate-binding protein ZnuA [Azospirillum sp.]